ncbi:Scr1 family TA system antitoxin-like transcriptional regulator [Streptomyces niveus]|uniref:Scr1 family TA system antitoxin-like transcriptional regulator n=1 Tax=Streptomyces niveus TaxID=193462 RepID=UPI0035E34653
MPPRKAPTARQRRLGTELRKMRERAGYNIAEGAERVGTDRTTISNTESARFGVSAERVRAWANAYECPDEAYVDALADMAAERGQGWWEEYRNGLVNIALDLAELEHHAAGIRSVQIMHVPGVLQTEDYMRAVYEGAVPAISPTRLRRRLSHRLKRRDVLDRENPPTCTFLIHEAALRMVYGGVKVARNQLDYLLSESHRENVTIRAIPFAAGGFPNAGSSSQYLYGVVPQLDTVQTDTPSGSAFLDAETPLANWRAVLDRTEECSLDPDSSRDFIRTIAKQL